MNDLQLILELERIAKLSFEDPIKAQAEWHKLPLQGSFRGLWDAVGLLILDNKGSLRPIRPPRQE